MRMCAECGATGNNQEHHVFYRIALKDTIDTIEIERIKLHELMEQGASREDIQSQSEILDRHIVNYYR